MLTNTRNYSKLRAKVLKCNYLTKNRRSKFKLMMYFGFIYALKRARVPEFSFPMKLTEVQPTSPMDCHLNVVEKFEFSMIPRAMLSVVFNHFHQGYPRR